jgi:hypothetical protein
MNSWMNRPDRSAKSVVAKTATTRSARPDRRPIETLPSVATTIKQVRHDQIDETETSLYRSRGKAFAGGTDPSTCITASVETFDDDRSASLLGVIAPS